MSAPLLLDLSHTSHTRVRTGIQRVARSLRTALGDSAIDITFDPYRRSWRTLLSWEIDNLESRKPGRKRSSRWPLTAQLRGRAGRLFGGKKIPALPPEVGGIVFPELFSPAVASAMPDLESVTGPRVALFHDAIPLKLPELSPVKTVARFPGYLRELLRFDGIAAVSDDSRDSLLDYWRWLDVPDQPPVRTIPLGVDFAAPGERRVAADLEPVPAGDTRRTILSVGTIEGRKNHLALLDACEFLWSRGVQFELHLVGLARPETAATALARIRALQAAGRPLRYDGAADDRTLAAAYRSCAFTVYPSLLEGFGLPVLESLAHGKPCICSSRGALGESAHGGGCVMLDPVNAATLAPAIELLLSNDSELTRLNVAARQRIFRSWADYVSDLKDWIGALPRRG